MNRSINNGGPTHIRYAHYHYPRCVALTCPKCHKKALATNKDAPETIEYFMDIACFEKLWDIKCLSCDLRLVLNWEQTKQLKLWLTAQIRGIEFWAWNEAHLNMILKRLKNENLESDRWQTFASYIPGKWLSKLNGHSALLKIEHLLQDRG